MADKELCVIVVTYNAEKWIDKCFNSFTNMPSGWEVLAIDNNSQDNCIEQIHKKYPFIKTIKNNKNLGFGAANNIGLKYALQENFKHVLLLNQDAWIAVDALKQLIALQEQNPDYYVISPLHCDGSTNSLDKNFASYMKNCTEDALAEDALIGKYKKNLYDCNFCNAAIWLLSQQCLKDIGGFSPSFYHYGEDNNYLDRVFFHGKKLGIASSVKANHERNYRPPSKKFHNKKEILYRNFLMKLSNPQKNNLKVFVEIILKSAEHAVSHLFRLRVKLAAIDCWALFKILIQKRTISKNRKISMQRGPSFLD